MIAWLVLKDHDHWRVGRGSGERYRVSATTMHMPICPAGSASCGKTATRLLRGEMNPSRLLADADVELYHMLGRPRSHVKIDCITVQLHEPVTRGAGSIGQCARSFDPGCVVLQH